MSVVALRLVIRGRVQGVGYRDAAVQSAFINNVAGWVRNRSDGTVEAFVQGRAGRGGAVSSSGRAADRRSRAWRQST